MGLLVQRVSRMIMAKPKFAVAVGRCEDAARRKI